MSRSSTTIFLLSLLFVSCSNTPNIQPQASLSPSNLEDEELLDKGPTGPSPVAIFMKKITAKIAPGHCPGCDFSKVKVKDFSQADLSSSNLSKANLEGFVLPLIDQIELTNPKRKRPQPSASTSPQPSASTSPSPQPSASASPSTQPSAPTSPCTQQDGTKPPKTSASTSPSPQPSVSTSPNPESNAKKSPKPSASTSPSPQSSALTSPCAQSSISTGPSVYPSASGNPTAEPSLFNTNFSGARLANTNLAKVLLSTDPAATSPANNKYVVEFIKTNKINLTDAILRDTTLINNVQIAPLICADANCTSFKPVRIPTTGKTPAGDDPASADKTKPTNPGDKTSTGGEPASGDKTAPTTEGKTSTDGEPASGDKTTPSTEAKTSTESELATEGKTPADNTGAKTADGSGG